MRVLGALLVVLVGSWVLSGDARAQPGQTPPAPPPGYGQGYQAQPLQLTFEESKMLRRGFYSDAQIVGGGLVGTFMGFGLGHAVQSRWEERGWVFTFGQAAGIGLMIYGIVDCAEDDFRDEYGNDDCSVGSIVLGALGYSILRIWELVDVWAGPASHNARLRSLRYRLGLDRPRYQRWSVYTAPPRRGRGGVAGFTLRF